jgi:hypothetical protein
MSFGFGLVQTFGFGRNFDLGMSFGFGLIQTFGFGRDFG